ncbi:MULTISPECIES: M23 family metallopeptidase [Streptomyces]|uniref:M23 family metallopeptidase n=1 Tax=Streptomyces solicathayae TaxID=3081768 RepID=A0ABZ0LSN0_9ACTN|nr:M23 family metallopeptidase [Streptomyces sp. HUAS YS2]WOX21824.1 M23 family metallopeptidase [Streptomyces sp. HUAS YS2]
MNTTALLLALALPVAFVWPVGPPRPEVVRPWSPPASPYGPGHRGVDLAAPPGTPVRAAAAGVVTFAGRVAGRGVLTITLPTTGDPPLRTTYTPVEPVAERGTEVAAGEVVASVSATPPHCKESCLHWGLLRGDVYLNPLTLIARPPSRLLPVFDVP